MAARKNATRSAAHAAICAELPRRVNGWRTMAEAIALDCGSDATGGKLQAATPDQVLKSACGLLTRDFHVAILDTIGIGRSAVRFATMRLEQTSGSPFVAWHAKSGRVVFVSSGGD
jgi:hypothetical protein